MLILYYIYFNISIHIILFYSVHPCDMKSKGGCGQICHKQGRRSRCSCKPGFKLADDKQSCDKGTYFIEDIITSWGSENYFVCFLNVSNYYG